MRGAEEVRLESGAEGFRVTEFSHHQYMMSFHGAKDLIEGLGFALVVGVAISLGEHERSPRSTDTNAPLAQLTKPPRPG
jgi:hypothetical protein